MNKHDNKTDRDLLIEVHSAVAVLQDRTEGLPDKLKQIEINQNDLKWVKRIGATILTFLTVMSGIVLSFLNPGGS